LKVRLAELIAARFADPRERRAEWASRPDRLAEARAAAADRAKKAARVVLDRARRACGVE
jgi:tryptophanyl-tRNA synthetase